MITLLVLTVCLFVLGLLFGKRFGVLVLALAAGLVVSGYMSATVSAVGAPYLKQYVAYVPAALVVAPSFVLLLFAKGRHRRIVARVIHAATYAVAGTIFIIAAPGTHVSISSSVPVVMSNLGLFITGLIGVAVLEAAFGKPAKKKAEEVPKH